MKRVGIYVRVSTAEQAEKGWSVEGQYRDIRAFCEKQEGWTVRRVFRDEGHSAASLDRPGMLKLLDWVQEGELDVLVVWKFDRLSRDNVDFPVLLHLLERHDVQVVSIHEPSLDRNSPYGEFVIGMLGLIATLERRVLQTRVKMGMPERSRKGLWHGGIPPFGYSYDPSTGRLLQEAGEAATVREAFDLYLTTRCLYTTRDALNSGGHRTRSDHRWSVPELRRILRRETYRGVLQSSGVAFHNSCLATVDEDTFRKAQRLLDLENPTSKNGEKTMRHQFGRKRGHPACPECGNVQTVWRRGKRILVSGVSLQLFYCNTCQRTFNRATARIPLPACPQCATRPPFSTSANGALVVACAFESSDAEPARIGSGS